MLESLTDDDDDDDDDDDTLRDYENLKSSCLFPPSSFPFAVFDFSSLLTHDNRDYLTKRREQHKGEERK